MKIAIVTDTHYGVRSDNIHILDHQKIFFDDIFFPYLKNNNIKTVVHLGDVVDRRKYINFNTLDRLHKDFLKPLHDITEEIVVIAGNHDTFYKNTNELNALDKIFKGYNSKVFTSDPVEHTFSDGTTVLLLPWICSENLRKSLKMIRNTKAKACFGHLQLIGFEMHKVS